MSDRESTRDIAVTRVTIQQGVELTLMQDGHEVTPPYAAPIAGRAGTLTVEFTPSFSGTHNVASLLEFERGGVKTLKELTRAVEGTSAMQSILFDLAADELVEGTNFRVRFVNVNEGASGSGAPAEYPSLATQPASLKLQKSAPLRIKLIPVRYDADGSGRIADSGPEHVEKLKQLFLDMYPITSVDITVGDPLPWSKKISSNGDGHDDLLDEVVALRAAEHAPDDVYYLALFATTATYAQYCGRSCTTGLSVRVTRASNAESRASVAVGYAEPRSMETSLHEIGHAHGREHAPCGVTKSDDSFPHENARLGSLGRAASSNAFYDPQKYYDFMSYCDPTWISDYNFGAILTRVQEVAALAPPQRGISLRKSMRMIQVRPTGVSQWGSISSLAHAPSGEPIEIVATSADGIKSIVSGYKYNYHDRPGGHVWVSPIDVEGKTIEFHFDGSNVKLDRYIGSMR